MRRRTFFGIVGAGAATAVVPISLAARPSGRGQSAAGRSLGDRTAVARSASLDFLLGALVGRPLPGGYRVSSVSDVAQGAVTITLTQRDGSSALVQAFRRSPLSSGLATTRLLDLRLMNGADGELTTHEGAGVAVMTLASRIRRVEDTTCRGGIGRDQRAAVRALSTHEHRNLVHGGFAFSGPARPRVERSLAELALTERA